MAGPSIPTVAGRLIDQPSVRELLLAAVAAVPAGQKLSIPSLRDRLVSQGDVIAGLEWLIRAGKLEAGTLRPAPSSGVPRKPTVARAEAAKLGSGHLPGDEPARPLFDALVAEGRRRGLVLEKISLSAFGNKARIYALRDGGPTVRRSTAEKIRAWIADSDQVVPEPGEDDRPEEAAPAAEPPPPVRLPGAALAAELDEFIARHGLSKSRVGRHLFSSTNGVEGLRRSAPYKATIAKVRAFLAATPTDDLKSQRASPPERCVPLGDRRFREHRDPTQRPDTPLMDLAERQKVAGQRHHANVRRAQEREAAERLDSGMPARNSFERTTMAHIEARRDTEARAADPVEQAKVALQRKGRSVYAADVAGGKAGHFHVSGKRDQDTGRLLELTPAALIAEAERVTGQSFRRAG